MSAAPTAPRPRTPRTSVALLVFLAAATAHLAKSILVPLALALLVTAALTPAVDALVRLRLPRRLAVGLVMAALLGLIAGVVFVVGSQLPLLTASASGYERNVRAKMSDLRAIVQAPTVRKLRDAATGVQEEIEAADPQQKSVNVIVDDGGTVFAHLPTLLEIVAHAVFVAVLVAFLLARQQDLRGRVIRLFGYAHLAMTTKALDEASSMISRYLRSMCLVNGCFGLLVGAGLVALRVPYAPLLAVLAAALRFIPYVGAWIGSLLPVLLSLAAFPGWSRALAVLLLFAVLEPLTGLVAEPLVFGQRLGISDVGVLLAAVFWTWLWGPPGLLLATPMTVCLVVLGRAVPQLGFLDVLLGEAAPLPPQRAYYERLLVQDHDAADEALEAFLHDRAAEQAFDGVLLPAVLQARDDRELGRISSAEMRALLGSVRRSIHGQVRAAAKETTEDSPRAAPPAVGIAAMDEADETALLMLRAMMPAEGDLVILPYTERPWRFLQADEEPAALCVMSIVRGADPRARLLVERLRSRLPHTPIVLCHPSSERAPLSAAGLEVVTTLADARDRLVARQEGPPRTPVAATRPGERGAAGARAEGGAPASVATKRAP